MTLTTLSRWAAALALAASSALVLAGCGQKGPLYLPEKKGGAAVTAPAEAPPPTPPPQSTPGPPPAAPAPVRGVAAVRAQPVVAAAQVPWREP